MENITITKKIRLISMLCDHMIMSCALYIPVLIGIFICTVRHILDWHWRYSGRALGVTVLCGLMVGGIIYICKDIIRGQSIAKNMLRLQIVDDEDGNPASPTQSIIRNLTLIIWPLEFVIALINPKKRLGDRLASTELIMVSDENSTKLKPVQNLIAVTCGFLGFQVLALIACFWLASLSNAQAFRTNSYNGILSRQANQICTDSLNKCLSPDIRIYDQMFGESGDGYVSAVFELKDDYISDERDVRAIRNKVHRLLSSILPKRNYKGTIHYIYRSKVSFKSLSTSY